jgi:hypothetical protein
VPSHEVGPAERNSLLCCFTRPACRSVFENQADQRAAMVAQMRAAYGHHVGDPGRGAARVVRQGVPASDAAAGLDPLNQLQPGLMYTKNRRTASADPNHGALPLWSFSPRRDRPPLYNQSSCHHMK